MEALIKITENNGNQAVSAKELYAFLETETRFDIWIKRMLEYGFTQDVDFQCLYKNVQMPNGGSKQALDDYALSLNCSKEISMIQRTDKGKQARQYFIECEKQALQKKPTHAIPQTFSEALMLAARQAEQLELQSAELKKQAPKVAYVDEVLQSQSTYVTNQIAKELGTSAITLNRKLKEKRIIYKQNGIYLLYQRYQDKGYSKTKTHTYTDSNGNQKTAMQLVWTEKGRAFLHQVLKTA